MRNIMRLGDVASYVNGFPFKPSDWSDMGVPIIRIQDLTGNGYQMNRFDGKYDAKYEVRAGDVLISWSASLGVYVWKLETAVLNQHIFKVRFDKVDVDKDFFVYQVECLLKKAARQAHGATMRHLTKPVFDGLPFYLPPKEEQKRIAVQLNAITRLIYIRQRQAEKLDELVKARFVDMFWGAYLEVIAEDVCEKIVDCPHSTPKYNESELKYPAIRTSEIQDGQIEWSSMKYVGINEYQRRVKRLIPEAGDIVYAREGTYGDCVILPEGYQFCLGQRTMLFRPNYKLCNSEYLHAVLRSAAVKYQADMSNAGSTVPHVNVSDAKRFHFPLPPLPLQNAFATFVHEVDREKERIQRSAALLETLKRSLMQQYFG